jgi:hypothetical protein
MYFHVSIRKKNTNVNTEIALPRNMYTLFFLYFYLDRCVNIYKNDSIYNGFVISISDYIIFRLYVKDWIFIYISSSISLLLLKINNLVEDQSVLYSNLYRFQMKEKFSLCEKRSNWLSIVNYLLLWKFWGDSSIYLFIIKILRAKRVIQISNNPIVKEMQKTLAFHRFLNEFLSK